jgi:hypothetical protein
MENLFISIYPPRASSKLVGWPSSLFSACLIGRLRSVPKLLATKTKIPPQVASGGGILELLVMILVY